MTIRLRLTLWYTALLGATLILFSVLVYSLLAANLWMQVRQDAKTQAHKITHLVTQEFLGTQQLLVIRDWKMKFPELDLFTAGAGAQIVDPSGAIIQRSENLRAMAVPHYRDALPSIRQGSEYAYYAQSGDYPFYIFSTPLIVENALTNEQIIWGAVQIVQPIDAVQKTLSQVSRYLILGTAFSLVLAAIVGAVIAHRALMPIGVITTTANSITRTRDLGRRLQIGDDASEIGQLAATFNDMLDRVQKLFETQERLIADVSHELRTPLTAMQGNLELLQRMTTAGAVVDGPNVAQNELFHEALSEAKHETTRMTKMVNDLLLLAQADSGALQLRLAPVEMDTLLLEVFRQTKRMAELRKLTNPLEIRLGHEDQALVCGDRERLRQLLLNLAENAVKYSPDGGMITLSLQKEDQWVKVSVSDTGIGIHPDNQDKIFERFYRTDKARSRELGGSGLGLSIVQWIAQAHNGWVSVQSAPHQGSTFTLWLPQIDSSSNAPDSAHSTPPPDMLRPWSDN